VLNLTPKLEGKTVNTTILAEKMFTLRNKHSVADLACSTQTYLAKGLARLAIEEAEQLNVGNIGFSGGVAYNEHITRTIRKIIKKSGLAFFVHHHVPPGDGGVAFGQAIVAASST
jgi:hydrogenase maturation protein HypF